MSLFVVGIGPGDENYLTNAAKSAISRCEHIIGYDFYLGLISHYLQGKKCHAYSLGQEQERVRHALKLAASGLPCCLVSSGDAGIYAMASLVFEVLQKEYEALNVPVPKVEVIPGISAMQAVAARIGSPLGHDFAVISLSDLLTPWSVIEKRLEAAAQADFVLVLYNPASKSRTRQIVTAKDICRRYRKANTPVIIGRNISRKNESIDQICLDQLADARVDMLSLVIIGNSQTVASPSGVYTPRGYSVGV